MLQQKNKMILLSLTIGAASLSTFASNAFAKPPDIYFYPKTSWKTGTNQNCSINNEFNNGFIIEITGSHKWTETLNIDFRQDAFEIGKKYDVSVSVPGKLKKYLPARASQSNLLALNMENQKDLYEALRNNAVMDLSIGGNEFRFYFTGFSNAAASFERCMAGGALKPTKTKENNPAIINESIAFEEEERKSAVIEISDETSKPVIQKIPVAEKIKLGNEVIKQSEPIPITKSRALIEEIEAPPPLEATRATIDNSFSPPRYDEERPRKRMTEMLEDEIENNPDIVGIIGFEEDIRPDLREKLRPGAKDTPLEIPPGFDKRPELKKPGEISKETHDSTKLDKVEPAGIDDNASISERISRLEKMISKMEKENAAFKSSLKQQNN